jgi:TetR/AcrR family transcriptional regulator, transcriptional repressor for nem operon
LGRPKQFEADDALREAGFLFWSRGYKSTSISDLEHELGIGRKSLYDTFGDKRELFLRILDRYVTAPYPVSSPSAGFEEIERTFLESPSLDPTHRACLLANTIVEFGVDDDPDVAIRITTHLQRLEGLFVRALRHAIAAGEIAALDVPATARYLTSSLQGIAVMARAGASHDSLKEIVRVVLSVLRPPAR